MKIAGTYIAYHPTLPYPTIQHLLALKRTLALFLFRAMVLILQAAVSQLSFYHASANKGRQNLYRY